MIIDMPPLPAQEVEIVQLAEAGNRPWPLLLARAAQGQETPALKERTIGVCMDAQNPKEGLQNLNYLTPDIAAQMYFQEYEKSKFVQTPVLGKLELVQSPKHGAVEILESKDGSGYQYVVYIPNINFLKTDKAIFRINVNGIPVKVVYRFEVTREGDDYKNQERRCPKMGGHWKISTAPTEDNANLAALLAGAGQSLTFADLSGAS